VKRGPATLKPLSYGRQQLTDADIQSVVEVLKSDFLTQGPQVERFESEMSRVLGGALTVAVGNGTAALHLSALVLGVKPGDRVLVPSNTFVASANCIRFCGGDVEFVDIDPITYCMDLRDLKKKVESRPKGYYQGIVTVAFAGFAPDLAELKRIADAASLWIIEDACHALGVGTEPAPPNSPTWPCSPSIPSNTSPPAKAA
jgi:dTDP-4-amino-4,6-dideoxygalactose transaminase